MRNSALELKESATKMSNLPNSIIVKLLSDIKNKVAVKMYLNELKPLLGSRMQYVIRDLNA